MTDTSRLLDALAFAAGKHSTQRRKDAAASPYINHPIALAQVLCNEAGITETVVLCAALLHDTRNCGSDSATPSRRSSSR